MAPTPLIAIGASAGGIEALRKLGPTLPSDLAAAVAIVLHRLPVEEDERLPRVLGAGLTLPASHAKDGETIRPGHIYIAPANVHLVVEDNRFGLESGPYENGNRPAIDVFFRSAAHSKGPAVAGVVLSGALDDGAAGLAAIKAHGGLAIVQDPREASFNGMPLSAIRNVEVDAIAKVGEMAPLLVDFANRKHPAAGRDFAY